MKLQEILDASPLNLISEGEQYTKEYCQNFFQNVPFGEFRGKEADTKPEEEAFGILYDFVRVNARSEVGNVFKVIKGCRQYYSEFLPNNRQFVVRGISYPLGQLPPVEKFSELTNEHAREGDDVLYWAPHLYKPRNGFDSWSVVEGRNPYEWDEVDTITHMEWYSEGEIQVTLSSRVDDDFIFSGDFMNMISKMIWGFNENETIRLSNKPMQTMLLINSEIYRRLRESQ